MVSRSISFHLGLLVVMVAAPLLLLTIGLLLWSAALSRQAVDRSLEETTRVLAIAVEQEIATWTSALNALAASPDLSCEPSQRFYEQAKAVGAQQGAWVSLADPMGAQRMNTLRPLGTTLPGAPEAALIFEAMTEGQPLVSDIFIGPLSGGPLLFISVPVGPAGNPQCWLSMAFGPEHFSSLLHPPAGSSWTSILTDGRHTVISASGHKGGNVGGSYAPHWFAAASARESARVVNAEGFGHGPVRMAYQRVNSGRWTLAVAGPRADLYSTWVSPVAVGAIGSLLLIAAALVVAAAYAARMKREVDRLVGQAARVGEHTPRVAPPASSVREVAMLHKVLARADEDVRQRRTEHEMRVASEAKRIAAESASRSKDLFLATLSHELRGPLTAVVGWLDMARMSVGDEATLRSALDIALRNAMQQARIIDDLLDVSRIVSGKFSVERQPMDLGRLAREAVDASRPAADDRALELRCMVRGQALVLGDRQRLHQALGNLIGNAIKFNRRGGWVEVTLERRGAQFQLVVADSGVGIERNALPHIFERFWQAEGGSRKQAGLGLGLPLVQHVVELHAGRIRAESEGPGRGARFTIEIPGLDAAQAHPPAESAAREAREPGLAGLAVVAVDDDADTRGWLQAVLTRHGALAWCASSVDEALALLDRVRPGLLISDLAMPGSDGYALIRSSRERQGAMRIAALAFSGQATQEARERALDAGYDAFVAKPCDAGTLVAALVAVLNRQVLTAQRE